MHGDGCLGCEDMERKVKFSILVVSLNSGNKLPETIKSILSQTFSDYEVIVKDGGSKDDSLEVLEQYLKENPEGSDRVRVVRQKDTGIYEGMNQATKEAQGEYYYFLNCGDLFVDEDVLEKMAGCVDLAVKTGNKSLIFYGNIFDELRKQVVASNPHVDAFACYRNVPCHQACIYHYSLFEERGYNPKYRVRADYEHFLWCFFRKEAKPQYMDVVIASYEGGGFSETEENRIRSKQEHKEITAMYMSKGQLLRYKAVLVLTLAPLRTKMAESPKWAGFYNKCKSMLYKNKH